MYGQSSPKLCYQKRYAQYSKVFEEGWVAFTNHSKYDGQFTLWHANISLAPGMNVTWWIMYDDSTNSSKRWFKALPDPFQSYYGLGLLESWSEQSWSASTLLDKLDQVNATFVIPITTWGQKSGTTDRYYYPFANQSDLYPAEDGSIQTNALYLEDWISQLDTKDPNRTKYFLAWFFYHRSFRDESPMEIPCPRTQEEWDAVVDKLLSIVAKEPSFVAFVLDQEYASYHEVEELWRLYRDWDDNSDLTMNSTEEEKHIVETFLDPIRAARWIDYGGQPHGTYRWNSHVLPERANLRPSVNHFQHCDANGGTPEYFRQIGYAVPGYLSGNVNWVPGLLTMGVSPSCSDLATDYKLHWTNETHGTSTQWDDFGFADQLLYAFLLNPRWVTLWVSGAWDDTTEPYAFTQDEKDFANDIALIFKEIPYISNLTYTYRPSGGTLATLSYSELGTKPAWFSCNASQGLYYSIMKETGSMYQLVVSNLNRTESKVLNVTIGSGLFTQLGVSELAAFNAEDGSGWTKLADASGQRDFQISLSNCTYKVYKFGVPFEVLGLPFDYDGWNFTAHSDYPSKSSLNPISYDYDTKTLSINVSSPLGQFFAYYVPSGESWSLVINGTTYYSNALLDISGSPRYLLGLIGVAGSAPGDTTPPTIVNSPTTPQTLKQGQTLSYWQFGDKNPSDYYIYRNGTLVDSGSWTNATQITYSIPSTLTVGLYNITCKATDTAGNKVVSTVWVTVTKRATWVGPVFVLAAAGAVATAAKYARKAWDKLRRRLSR